MIIYGSENIYYKHNNWNEYRKKFLMKQPLWWILETLDMNQKPLGYNKEKIIDKHIDDLWEEFIDSCDCIG